MRRLWALGILGVGLATAVMAVPPGPIDGVNIPSNFGAGNLHATQRNHTGFGNYTLTTGALIEGNEADQLYLAASPAGTHLVVGIKGNVSTNGNAFMIGLGVPGRVGQTESRAEGVEGPPFTLQDTGKQIVVSDNGTPGDTMDDTWSYGDAGMIYPCETDFVIAVDAFGGTASVSEYALYDPSGPPQGTKDHTPGNPSDTLQDLYAVRTFVTQGPTNDLNSTFENDQALGYGEGGFDNRNTAGVTATDGSSAATADKGLEIAIPFARLGLAGTETIQVFVLLMDGAGTDTGTVTNQVLPAVTGGGVCSPAAVIGKRTDLSTVMSCTTIDLGTLPIYAGIADGDLSDAATEYAGAAIASQACPTPYGDQTFDPMGVTRTGGSELDALYMTTDSLNLYLGVTGNFEENGNRCQVFIDSVPGGVSTVAYDGMGTGGSGLEGDVLPPLEADTSMMVPYDYVLSFNASGPRGTAPVYIDHWNLQAQTSSYRGFSTMETGSGAINNGGAAPNPWGMQLAVNNTNNTGVNGCNLFEAPCWADSSATVAALAAMATSGAEFVIPLADIGIDPCGGPVDLNVWLLITGGDGYRSNQALPSARGDGGTSVWNGQNSVTDWYKDVPPPLIETYYKAVATAITFTPGALVNDCNGNSVEDACDILATTSADANNSGAPDECELGACCANDGGCSQTFAATCAGTFQGATTECGGGGGRGELPQCPQPGACCLGVECTEVLAEDCGGGEFQGEGTQCSTNPCEEPTGACCRSDGSCYESIEDDCTAYVCNVNTLQDGAHGFGACGLNVGGCCYADADGNGTVNPGDRGFVSANIGESANDLRCLYDMDGNGTINPADRGFVSANINVCTALPNYMNGSGLNAAGDGPDPRFSAAFSGGGTSCEGGCSR